MRNHYDYDDAEDGMQDAVERRREMEQGADGNPVAYDPADQPMPDEPSGEMVLPEMDFRDQSDEDVKADLKAEPAASAGYAAPKSGPSPFAETKPDEEYTTALRRIKERLSQPSPDYGKGYAEAQGQDRSENRRNRVLDYMMAGLKRSEHVDLTPGATNASAFLRKQGLDQQREGGELSRLGALARLTKPAAPKGAGKDAGNVDGLRAYLVKVGAGTSEELAGMNEKQLAHVMSAYGLKHNIDREPTEDEQKRLNHEDSVRHTRTMEALAARGLENRETEADRKKTEDIPPGYEIAPGGNPGTDSRKKFTALVASQQKLKGLTAKMREMTKDMGRIDRIGNYDALNQLATQIGIEGKNVAELGALSGPDMDLMEAMVQNPAKAWNIFRNSDVAKNMTGLDSWADESVKAGESAYGLRRVGGGGGDGDIKPHGAVRMSNGKETRMVPPQHVKAARAEGYKEI